MTIDRPRVAVTGIGMVTGLGRDTATTIRRLMAGEVAIAPAREVVHRCSKTPLVAEVTSLTPEPNQSKSDCFALAAAREALGEAGLSGAAFEIVIGASTGATSEGIAQSAASSEQSVAPLVAKMVSEPIGAIGATLVSALDGAVNATVLCSACSSGAAAIAVGAMRLEAGSTRPQLVGGCDSLSLLTLSGFEALGALSPVPCRPFDVERSGLNLGEGAAFLVLESEQMVRARQVDVLVWLDGYALGAEAHHLTHPEPDGRRAAALIAEALRRARISASSVGYVNAHGTATIANDDMEAKALRAVLGNAATHAHVSSSKGQLGHTLAAAGAVEAAITARSLVEQMAPPTMGLVRPAANCQLRHVLGEAVAEEFTAALSNSFGFGGACAVLVMQRGDQPRAHLPPMMSGTGTVPSSAQLEPVWVTGVVTLGPAGILRGSDNAAWLDRTIDDAAVALPFEPLDSLVMERSRRFDRVTALTAHGCTCALETSGLAEYQHQSTDVALADESSRAIGLVLGNALGAVGRSASFVQRILTRGPKGANPAEFPHLLPSAISGNASIYSDLRGPAFNVSDCGATAQLAMELGVTCIRAGLSRAMLVGTTECRDDAITEARREGATLPMYPADCSDASAWLVLEGRSSALDRKAEGCELVGAGWIAQTVDDAARAAPTTPMDDCLVLWAAAEDSAAPEVVARLGWSGIAMRRHAAPAAYGWAQPGFVLGAGAALVMKGICRSLLAITDSPRGLHWAHFRSVRT